MGFWRSTFEEVGGTPKQSWLTPPGTEKSDVAHFLDCIEQGRQSDVSAEVGAEVMRVLMAAYESAATGRFVALAE
jgi:predicted dehydrogenase